MERAIIEQCLLAAGTAPSCANLQPWHFVVVSDPAIKQDDPRRGGAAGTRLLPWTRPPQEWLDLLAPLGTHERKEYLEVAPYLIAVSAASHGVRPDGKKIKHHYVRGSVGASP